MAGTLLTKLDSTAMVTVLSTGTLIQVEPADGRE